jgi:hypothetical protein
MIRRSKLFTAFLLVTISAALFLGVGAALPIWTVRLPIFVIAGTPQPRPAPGDPAQDLPPHDPWGPLWTAANSVIQERRYLNGIGTPTPLLEWNDQVVWGPLLLLAAGATVGLYCYAAWHRGVARALARRQAQCSGVGVPPIR